MSLPLAAEVDRLRRLSLLELRQRFQELFGETTRTSNRTWLVKRLAWRLQALAEGDLSERARRRAAELACDADLRVIPPRTVKGNDTLKEPNACARPTSDVRLPLPGTVLTRVYKGQTVQVQVLTDGFAFGGHLYKSLSAVAKAITGSHCNGFWFFGLTKQGGER